jgi:hypothetical protein
MKNSYWHVLISVTITSLLGIFIFHVNNADPKPGIGMYVKLEVIKYMSLACGCVLLIIGILYNFRKIRIQHHFLNILLATVNTAFGFAGAVAFIYNQQYKQILHEFLPNLLLGVLLWCISNMD